MPATKAIFDLMCETFTKARDDRTAHNTCISTLSQAYNNYDFDEFYESYEKCIQIPLSYVEKEESIENSIEFGVLFAVKVTPKAQDDDTESPFLKRVFKFILDKHNADLPGIRYRICYFLHLILNAMGDNTHLSGELSNKIIDAMLIRIKDISPKVRGQAVRALHRMQQPGVDTCKVIEAYIFNLSHDPSSHVRKAVIKNIVENVKTRQSVIERTHDIDYSVRKMAYIFLTRIIPESFKIKQRREILSNGLKDENKKVSKLVKELLLRAWLSYYNNEITKLLYALDIEIAIDVGIIVLNNLFKILTVDELIEQLPINQDTKIIPIDKLTSENVLFWHYFLKYLQKSKLTVLFDQTLPKLSYFCHYIRQYREHIVNHPSTKDYHEITEQLILCQLFEMTKLYDLSDEDGKNNLKILLDDTVMSEIPELKLTELIVEIYEKVEPNVTNRIDILINFINSIGIPCDDPSNLLLAEEKIKNCRRMSKCLGIMCSMLRSLTITKVTPVIKIIFDKILLTSIHHDDKDIQVQALNAVGLCSLLDSKLAQEHMHLFFNVLVDNNYQKSWTMSLGIIFDLFLKYGLDHFGLVDPADNTSDDKEKTTSRKVSQLDTPDVIKTLSLFFDCEVPAIQLSTVEGFIRLLFKGTINNVQIVSRLIVLLHMPYSNNPQLEGSVKTFFKYYPILRKKNQKTLEKLFLPTILDIFNAPPDSKLFGIDPSNVGHFILDLTRYKIYKTQTDDSHYIAHNNISYCMLKEIINSNSENYVTILVKCLAYVDIKITDEALQNEMLAMCDAVIEKLSEMKTLKLFKKFRSFLKPNEQIDDNILEESEESEESEEPEESEDDDDNIEDDSDME